MGKGSKRRPTDMKRYMDNYEKIFGAKPTTNAQPNKDKAKQLGTVSRGQDSSTTGLR